MDEWEWVDEWGRWLGGMEWVGGWVDCLYLSGIAKVWNDGRDPLGRGPLHGGDGKEELHHAR